MAAAAGALAHKLRPPGGWAGGMEALHEAQLPGLLAQAGHYVADLQQQLADVRWVTLLVSLSVCCCPLAQPPLPAAPVPVQANLSRSLLLHVE